MLGFFVCIECAQWSAGSQLTTSCSFFFSCRSVHFLKRYRQPAALSKQPHALLQLCTSSSLSRSCVRSGSGADHKVWVKGSVERSLLPWAIFLIFTQNRPWKSEDHLCALFFIEMSKERLEKSERIPPVSWRHWALAYSRDRRYNFSCLSAVSKTAVFTVFSRLWGVIWRGKAFRDQQCQFQTRNKSLSSENQSNSFDDFWVRAYRFDFAPRRRPRARSM